MTNYAATTDSEIRSALHRKRLRHQKSQPNTLVIDELGLAHARSRIDIAVINGYIHGYEIKSAQDNLDRLGSQLKVYRQTLQKLTIVTAPKHMPKILSEVGRPRYLPPLYELIEEGKVLALNMPAGSNPALARAIGVMLKNAWLQALLMRPAQMKESPSTYFRPAVFICDEYQSFASVGEDDPTGDEKSFALTRQCRCIPIVATQSISSLRAVLGSSEAWRRSYRHSAPGSFYP